MEIVSACQMWMFVEDSNSGMTELIYEQLVSVAGMKDRAQLDGKPDGLAEVGCKEALQRCHGPSKDSWTDLMPYTIEEFVTLNTLLDDVFLYGLHFDRTCAPTSFIDAE